MNGCPVQAPLAGPFVGPTAASLSYRSNSVGSESSRRLHSINKLYSLLCLGDRLTVQNQGVTIA